MSDKDKLPIAECNFCNGPGFITFVCRPSEQGYKMNIDIVCTSCIKSTAGPDDKVFYYEQEANEFIEQSRTKT